MSSLLTHYIIFMLSSPTQSHISRSDSTGKKNVWPPVLLPNLLVLYFKRSQLKPKQTSRNNISLKLCVSSLKVV